MSICTIGCTDSSSMPESLLRLKALPCLDRAYELHITTLCSLHTRFFLKCSLCSPHPLFPYTLAASTSLHPIHTHLQSVHPARALQQSWRSRALKSGTPAAPCPAAHPLHRTHADTLTHDCAPAGAEAGIAQRAFAACWQCCAAEWRSWLVVVVLVVLEHRGCTAPECARAAVVGVIGVSSRRERGCTFLCKTLRATAPLRGWGHCGGIVRMGPWCFAGHRQVIIWSRAGAVCKARDADTQACTVTRRLRSTQPWLQGLP